MAPALSIITPCLNRQGMIAEAIESVRCQDFDDVEHIIVDGASTDGTLEVVARYPHLRVISEPDLGLYDALNKGLKLARGHVIGHLNSDDRYAPGCFGAVMAAFESEPQLDSVCGSAVLEDEEGRKVVAEYRMAEHKDQSFTSALLGNPVINARFFTRAFYERCGGYDQAYPLTADRHFLVRAVRSGCRSRPLDLTVCHYRRHGGSLTYSGGADTARRLSREYLAMAHVWLNDPSAPAELHRVCRQLEGEALARMAWLCLREGRVGATFAGLLSRDGRPTLAPLISAAAAVTHRVFMAGRR
ncbi:MAG: glycosyltransferase family 2 protein [Rhodospirillaceae bacterium]